MVAVYRSTVIDAPIAEVWYFLRDFNAHKNWHPAVADSRIEGGKFPDQVGCVRRFRLRDGGELREQLLALSDASHRFIYCILDSPIPLFGYVAKVQLKPVTDSQRTFWEWSSSFETPPAREQELAELVGCKIYEAGFNAVKDTFRQPNRALAIPPSTPRRAPVSTRTDGDRIECNAIVIHRYGGPEELRWEAIEVPSPEPDEVRLRHTAVGLNYIDIYCRTGYFKLLQPPGIPGMEAAGVVTEVGEGVHGILPGDRVGYACAPVGAYSEYRTMKADLLVLLPAEIDDETAAAGLLKGMTAEFLLHRVHSVKQGDVVLVHAAAGGVGLLLCQWARHLGATVIGTVSSAAKARLARGQGCAYPILYSERDFVAEVREITSGRGADVIYDAVGRDTFRQSFEALAVQGHLVSFGQASGDIGSIEIADFATKSATVSRPNFGHYTATAEQVRAIIDRLFGALAQGVLKIQARHRYPLREAAAAHRALEERRTSGATILLS